MKELHYCTIAQISKKLYEKEISPVELLEITISRINIVDQKLKSYITVMEEEALESAKQAETELVKGNRRGPLHGVPIALKDLLFTKGVRTTAGSKVLENFVPEYNATVVDKLQESGAIITGKLNMHEFAFGTTNENPHYGNVKNPWDVTRIPGGSSGGNGAAVAAGLCYASIGSDTGGSIRTPAALCDIVGLKPTFGRVSKYGSVPLSWSLDHIGPMARTVEDVAIVLECIAGFDKNDPTTIQKAVPNFSMGLNRGVKGLRIGVPTNYFFDSVETEVEKSLEVAIKDLQKMGAIVTEITIPELDLAMYSELVTIRSEAIAYHQETFDKQKQCYGKDVCNSLSVGQLITATQYIKAQQARRKVQEGISRAFEKVDVIVAPTVTMTAPKIGSIYKKIDEVDKAISSEFVRMAAPANLTGIPSISIPTGFSSSKLPIAMQIMGRPFDELTLLRVAATYERETNCTEYVPIN